MLRNGGDYSPFSVSPAVSSLTFDETHAYAPPARHLLLTGRIDAEVDVFERRTLSAGIPFVPTAILGGLGRLLGSLERAFIAADCIFPALLFFLLYSLSRCFVSEVSLRLLLAWSSLLIPFGLLNSLWLGDDALIAPLEVTRTPQPEISFVALLLAVSLLGRALGPSGSNRWLVLSGVVSGTVVYCYYFYAVAWGIALALLILLGAFWKVRLLWSRAAVTLTLMSVLAIPYARVALRGKRQGGQNFLLARMGEATHRPSLLALAIALLLTFALWRWARGRWQVMPCCFILAVLTTAAFYGMNFQILSGYETQPWHFWKRLAVPVAFFLVAGGLGRWSELAFRLDLGKLRRFAQLVLLAVVLDSAARLTYAGFVTSPFQRATSPDQSLLVWLRDHTPSGRVVGTVNPELILLIPALTADYTYVPSGLRSLTSNAEIMGRYFDLACLYGLSPVQVANAAAVPSHLGRSFELLHVLGLTYVGDRAAYRSFVSQYAAARTTCLAPRWRLDAAIVSTTAEESAVRHSFPAARTIYHNGRYQLLDLRGGMGLP